MCTNPNYEEVNLPSQSGPIHQTCVDFGSGLLLVAGLRTAQTFDAKRVPLWVFHESLRQYRMAALFPKEIARLNGPISLEVAGQYALRSEPTADTPKTVLAVSCARMSHTRDHFILRLQLNASYLLALFNTPIGSVPLNELPVFTDLFFAKDSHLDSEQVSDEIPTYYSSSDSEQREERREKRRELLEERRSLMARMRNTEPMYEDVFDLRETYDSLTAAVDALNDFLSVPDFGRGFQCVLLKPHVIVINEKSKDKSGVDSVDLRNCAKSQAELRRELAVLLHNTEPNAHSILDEHLVIVGGINNSSGVILIRGLQPNGSLVSTQTQMQKMTDDLADYRSAEIPLSSSRLPPLLSTVPTSVKPQLVDSDTNIHLRLPLAEANNGWCDHRTVRVSPCEALLVSKIGSVALVMRLTVTLHKAVGANGEAMLCRPKYSLQFAKMSGLPHMRHLDFSLVASAPNLGENLDDSGSEFIGKNGTDSILSECPHFDRYEQRPVKCHCCDGAEVGSRFVYCVGGIVHEKDAGRTIHGHRHMVPTDAVFALDLRNALEVARSSALSVKSAATGWVQLAPLSLVRPTFRTAACLTRSTLHLVGGYYSLLNPRTVNKHSLLPLSKEFKQRMVDALTEATKYRVTRDVCALIADFALDFDTCFVNCEMEKQTVKRIFFTNDVIFWLASVVAVFVAFVLAFVLGNWVLSDLRW